MEGRYVGKYRILGELGRGSMGVVYRALDEALNREVALKSPLPARAGEEDRRRFLREARASARISHPNIVPIYEVFEDNTVPWLAMELVDGRTLRSALKNERTLSVERVIGVGEQVAEALDAAHSRGVLHRDVNPSNVMLTSRGTARLMDFGLARLFSGSLDFGKHSETSIELQSGIVGTLGYISPEQILARPLEPASDLFSVGAILYECLTGRRAFGGDTTGEIFDATLSINPPPILALAPDAPAELQRIIDKALAKRPDERYQSAREMAADLRRLRRRLESGSNDAPVVVPRRFPIRALLAAVLVLAGTTGVVWFAARPTNQINLGPPHQLTAAAGWEAEPAVGPDGQLVAYSSNESGNPDIWLLDMRGGNTLRLTEDPATDRTPKWVPNGGLLFVSDRSGRPSIWRMSSLGGPPSMMIDNAEDPALSPDGATIAFARRDASGHRIAVAPIEKPQHVRMLTRESDGLWSHRRPAWSPDGAQIVYQAIRDLWIVSLRDGRPRRLTTADAADAEPAWSPDGRYIYFSSNRGGTRALWRVTVSDGATERLTGGQGPEGQPALTSEGNRLVYSTFVDNTDLVLRDITSGREQRIGGERIEESPVFSPDHRMVAFISDRWMGRYDLWLQPLSEKGAVGEPRRLTDQTGSVAQPAYSPDGRWIAYHRALHGQRDIWIVSASGAQPVQFTSDPAQDVEPDWSPDGKRIVFVSNRGGAGELWTASIVDGHPAGQATRLLTSSTGIGSPSWSPDGSTIAFVGTDSNVWITAADGRWAAKRVTSAADAHRVAWNRSTGHLWASGLWGDGTLSLRILDVGTGRMRTPSPPVLFSNSGGGDFDLSPDGRAAVFARQDLRGDLWFQDFRPTQR